MPSTEPSTEPGTTSGTTPGIARTEQKDHTTVNHTTEPPLIDGARPLSAETVQALNELCGRAEDAAGSGVRTPLVLRVGGAPVPAAVPAPPLALVNKWERALRRLERLDLPTVALVSGDCGGTALEALLATDHRIATPGSRLLLPAAADGLWPGMALYRLANQAGIAATRQAVLFGGALPAERALALHLLDRLAADPSAALADDAESLAAASGGIAIRRQLMLDAGTTSFEEALGRHLAACDRLLRRTAAASS
ncbi:enoyl-CoA-hydratase DpgB [Streptacidiphilus sp. P02-A3a]|uniref:enoyl-CoA-hydratase DpgB n=1 Tax=Streptacidiphilus sp. P02-A3a TaxID=2704468 RepID=UPI0015F87C7C|nr:enoyl-CoA-hydratase DpgB [Streptacidiphilus sp. P02-A3a]QMU70590.1 enoyl-CoA hydratase/isomerase family protein [Streptacidiphilus sp. P02-A3a]